MSDAVSVIYDLAIVGGGPTGLYAAFYAGLRQMRTLLIDSLPILGGQLATLYPEKYIYDVAGFPAVRAKDLAASLIQQGTRYAPATALGEQVQALHRGDLTGVYTTRTSVSEHRSRAVLIAAGIGAFQPKRLALAEAARFEGKGLFYTVVDPAAFRGRRVLIVGGGDSAIDWANALVPLAAHVTLIHRRDRFRAHEGNVDQLRRSLARIAVFHELRSIHGDEHVSGATIFDNRTGVEETLPMDTVLVNVGFESSLGPLRHWGLDIVGGSIKVDHTMQTSRPGIFAAGDIATYLGKLKLLSIGFGEAAIAVNHAKHYLDPESNVFPGHSTNLVR